MIKVEWLYWLIGLVFVVMAVQMATDRSNPKRWTSAGFWGLLGLTFPYGTGVANATAGNGGWTLPAEPLGVAVLALIVLAGFNFLGKGVPVTTTGEQREASAARLGNKIFVPALTIPLVAIVCASVLDESGLFESGKATLLGLGLGCVAALGVGMLITGEKKVSVPLHSGRSMLEAMGSALLLPQLLAVLGSIFAAAGVGDQVGKIVNEVLPDDSKYLAVIAYCVGMFLFTVIMGNAFAAFPVMTAAIGWPVLIQQMHGNEPAVLAIGMLAGFAGTLCTPMAANFNIVPATLLELKDQYGPIKAQLPTGIALLGCCTVIMALFAF
ncbi:DUF979 domain-containing protein [Streptomyces rochei]|uniref:DUF979 domain-containing protein n=3 Tax=Streptomyces rochei group TaxID=2867164 RepID=A0AAX3ZT77_STRRO|nr:MULTISPECIES: DUF979 domain-containing protein [Streptomyces]RIH58898.1 DUF979 domain-containing protein [Streptomyces sp. SHP22-7]KYK12853.1 hypothetical protein AUW26_34795 [Streptomyces sp. CC71]MBJ6623188.1 DUF979 domain-containing protein [Streptomyces sp. DHE17-7]MBQ0877795.1 DUF979 domain-containing protein [Streptomyces sp. RT42]MBQ0912973.1 DUF979 domain-containing protein [Streptomyces sp. RM99]